MSDFLRRHSDSIWECYLCGEKFESEASKDSHMTQCVATDSDDSPIHVANRFTISPPYRNAIPPYQGNPADAGMFRGPDDFSAPVGPKREPAQVQLAAPADFRYPPNQHIPDPYMQRQIQYPPNVGNPYKPVVMNPHISSYLTDKPRNPLFQASNIYRADFISSPPIQQTSRFAYTPRVPLQQYLLRAPVPATPPPTQLPLQTTQQTIKIRPPDPISNVPRANPAPNPPPFQQREIYPYKEPSASKLLSTRVSENASVHPPVRTADGKCEVKLTWEKQQPTLERELQYFGEKEGHITFHWDQRKEIFHAKAMLSPGEHSGTLLLPDRDEVFALKPFKVSPHSVGVQEIRVDLENIAIRSKSTQQPLKAHSTQGSDRAALPQEMRYEEPPVLYSQHRPLFQARREEAEAPREEKGDAPRGKIRTFLVNQRTEVAREREIPHAQHRPLIQPRREEVEAVREERREAQREKSRTIPTNLSQGVAREREAPRSPPFQSLPAPSEPAEEPLPFQNNVLRENSIEKEKTVTGIQLTQPQREERRLEIAQPPSLSRPVNFPRPQAENEMNEPSRKVERERKLEMELGEWKKRNRILELSMETAGNENDILKREVDQLKFRAKQANAREVEELKLSLMQAKKEMEVLRAETERRLQQSEQLEQEREKRDLEKLKQVQTEGESYKRAAYRYREDREKAKLEVEQMARAYGEYKQKYDDMLREFPHYMAKLKQTEEETIQLKAKNEFLEQRLRDSDKTRRQNSNDFEFRTSKLNQPTSLGSFLDRNSPEENVSEKKSYLHTPDGAFSSLNPTTSLPSYSSSTVKADTAPIKKTSTVHDQVMLLQKGGENRALEESKPSTPRAVPRVFRHPSNSNGDGIERYNPDVLTVFLNKTQPLIFNASAVKTTNLSYLKKPDSHRSKQVLVKIKGNLRLGYLKVLFSKKHSYLNKTEMIAGILLQEPVGTSNGVHESTRHFDCPVNHAVFVSMREVYIPVI